MKQLNENEKIANKNRFEIMELSAERDSLRKQLDEVSFAHRKCKQRENMFHLKISEALELAEDAIKEKFKSEEREKELKGW